MSKHGILLLDKPLGWTSNQALGRAKRILGIRKAGHTGALDPLATGLLPLCFGEATKVSAFLLDADKSYIAELRLGETTASGDAEGEVLERRDVPALGQGDLEQVLAAFRGDIDQIPPMYSALKHQGRRLHELARRGEEVERKPRRITIHRLEIVEFDSETDPGRLVIAVDCSKGTYIRSLAMDIGERLGCGAHLTALRRTVSGPFAIADAIDLETLEGLAPEAARALLIAPDRALQHLPEACLDAVHAPDIHHGRPVPAPQGIPPGPCRMYSGKQFLGIGQVTDDGRLHPKRLLLVGEE